MSEGINSSEQFVYEVCQRSFLSLWSYANPQGRTSGKELCDILVVCDPHVVVMSVKDVELKDSGRPRVDRERWQRKAIEASVKQIEGAIRWLDQAKTVVTKDGAEGLTLPPLSRRVYHRIAVAFGGRREVAISVGSIQRDAFIHILDEESFWVLLRHLDTISDLVKYLGDKEDFLGRASAFIEGGEENLLAIYLHRGRQFPDQTDMLVLDGDLWEALEDKPEFGAKLERDKGSYAWDTLIESLCDSEQVPSTIPDAKVTDFEAALRVLAFEDRFCRRCLGNAFSSPLKKSLFA